jgi:hypothetical protein
MPTYRFKNNETGEEFDDFISNSRREELLEKNPHISQVPMPFGIVSITGSIDSKTDNGWKEVLNKVSEKHPDSPLADRYSKKSIKDVKTRQVVEKHRHKWRSN